MTKDELRAYLAEHFSTIIDRSNGSVAFEVTSDDGSTASLAIPEQWLAKHSRKEGMRELDAEGVVAALKAGGDFWMSPDGLKEWQSAT